MQDELCILKESLVLCISKSNDLSRSSSIAYSHSGKIYTAASVDSDTKITGLSSEHLALARAVLLNDFGIKKIVTLQENPIENEILSPLVGKVLVDYAIRTGNIIEYTVLNLEGTIFFHIDDVKKLFSFYSPSNKILSKTKNTSISDNKATLDTNENITDELKKYALMGIERNFPTSDSASGYGTAILTKNGTIYFGGQYSAFDKRMLLHSEVTTILSSLMEKNTEITHLGIVSTKYTDEPCNICGCCRQFISEISNKYNLDIQIFCFAKDSDISIMHTIDTYLPDSWTSKKW